MLAVWRNRNLLRTLTRLFTCSVFPSSSHSGRESILSPVVFSTWRFSPTFPLCFPSSLFYLSSEVRENVFGLLSFSFWSFKTFWSPVKIFLVVKHWSIQNAWNWSIHLTIYILMFSFDGGHSDGGQNDEEKVSITWICAPHKWWIVIFSSG